MSDSSNKEKATFQVTDRRFWAEDETVIDRSAEPEIKYPSFIEELKARTEAAENKLHERLRQLDEENAAFKERLNRQIEKRVELEKAQFIRGLLEFLDNSERALQAAQDPAHFDALREGVELNTNLMLARLKDAGVEPIESLNRPFDPEQAEAVGMRTTDQPDLDNIVVEELQRGYRLGEIILRPAKVQVARFVAG